MSPQTVVLVGNRERFVSSRVEDYKFWNGDERDERKSTKIETRKEICEGDQSILDGFKR
uniref:Uncharacterized protein n=1 Tax=Cucumis melo TaxID=3656 RepID=A0A9I9EDB8_CUCME